MRLCRVLRLSPVCPCTITECAGVRGCLADFAGLRARLQDEGYLLIRGLLPRDAVLAAREATVDFMDELGVLDPARKLEAGAGRGGALVRAGGRGAPIKPGETGVLLAKHQDTLVASPAVKVPLHLPIPNAGEPGGLPCSNRRALTHPAGQGLLEAAEIRALFAGLFGSPADTFPYKWLRAVGTGEFVSAQIHGVLSRVEHPFSIAMHCHHPRCSRCAAASLSLCLSPRLPGAECVLSPHVVRAGSAALVTDLVRRLPRTSIRSTWAGAAPASPPAVSCSRSYV